MTWPEMPRQHFALLALHFCLAVGLTLTPGYGVDLRAYLRGNVYYLAWITPVFSFLAVLPFPTAFVLWVILNTLALYAGIKALGGSIVLTLLSYQALWCLWYGQIVGLLVLGLALAVQGVEREDGWRLGLGLLLLTIKPQVGIPLALVCLAHSGWLTRERALLVGCGVLAASLLVYPGWPQAYAAAYPHAPVSFLGSIGYWPYSVPLWGLAFLRRWSLRQRLVVVSAVSALALPYYQHTGLLLLFALLPGWIAALSNLGYVSLLWGWSGLNLLLSVPIVVLLKMWIVTDGE